MLGSLFITQTVSAISFALDAADVRGTVAVLGQPRLGRALLERGRNVVLVSTKLKSLRRAPGPAVYAAPEALAFADRSVAAVVALGVARRQDWRQLIAEWSRTVIDSGALVLVDRVAASEPSRRGLCAGLVDIRQRHAGRTIITSGRVVKLPTSLASAG